MNIVRILACCTFVCASGWVYGTELPAAEQHTVPAQDFTATIIAVLDGDTVLIRRKTGLVKIRLAEIDAPEKHQAYGEASGLSLSGMVMKKQVRVITQAIDQYGRLIAHLSVDDVPDVNAEQIRRSMAWEYSNHHSNKLLVAVQNEAQAASRGLWKQSQPVPPWKWRKTHPYLPPDALAVVAGCGQKKHCSEMSSCEEARHYLVQCGLRSLDSNGDGTPCENLCAPLNGIKN